MRTALVDVVLEPPHTAGGLDFYPSPGLLRLGRSRARLGEEIFYHRYRFQPHVETSATAAGDIPAPLLNADRVLIAAPGPAFASGEALLGRLQQHQLEKGAAPAQLMDAGDASWIEARAETPDYRLARGHASCQAEIDTTPWWAPPHPWACSDLSGFGSAPLQCDDAMRTLAGSRLLDAAQSLAGSVGASLFLNDPRVPLDMDRLRALAALVQRMLEEHKTLVQLHLRVWPQDLVRDPRVAEHLSLLPLQSIDLLAGSFHGPTAARDARTGSLETVLAALSSMQTAGLSHLASVSIAAGLPGERAEECVDGMNRAVAAMVNARVRRLQVALCLGSGPAVRTATEQHQAFLRLHPDWHPMEYRGLFDMAALLQSAVPDLILVGPGLLPTWEPPASM